MTIYRILNAGQSIRPDARKRAWMDMGVPMIVAPHTTLTLRADRFDEKYFIHYTLRGLASGGLTPGTRGESEMLLDQSLPLFSWTNFSALCPLYALPRAVRYDAASERPVGILMEFVLLEAAIRAFEAAL